MSLYVWKYKYNKVWIKNCVFFVELTNHKQSINNYFILYPNMTRRCLKYFFKYIKGNNYADFYQRHRSLNSLCLCHIHFNILKRSYPSLCGRISKFHSVLKSNQSVTCLNTSNYRLPLAYGALMIWSTIY